MCKVFIFLQSNQHTSTIDIIIQVCILIDKLNKVPRITVDESLFFMFTITILEITGLPSYFYCSPHIESFICIFFFTFKKNPNYFELAAMSLVGECTIY